jgi:hypothetical protein
MVRKIKSFNTVVLSPADRDAIVDILFGANIQDKKARKHHNKSVHELKVANGF